jgi:hypothetical protein
MTYYAKVVTLNMSHDEKLKNNFFLSISMCHVTSPKFLQFLNFLREYKPIIKKLQTILSQCFINKHNIHFEMDAITTTISFTYKTNVEE